MGTYEYYRIEKSELQVTAEVECEECGKVYSWTNDISAEGEAFAGNILSRAQNPTQNEKFFQGYTAKNEATEKLKEKIENLIDGYTWLHATECPVCNHLPSWMTIVQKRESKLFWYTLCPSALVTIILLVLTWTSDTSSKFAYSCWIILMFAGLFYGLSQIVESIGSFNFWKLWNDEDSSGRPKYYFVDESGIRIELAELLKK